MKGPSPTKWRASPERENKPQQGSEVAFMTANGSITAQPDGPAVVPAVVSVEVSNSWAAPSDSVTSLSAPSNSTISRNNSAVGLSRLALSSPGSRSHTAKSQRSPATSLPLLRPPKDVHWSRAMQQLTGNSSKLLEDLMQTARQAVTVTLRALAQLRKAALEAARDRDRLGTQGRLVMRRAAVQSLIGSTRTLLCDLGQFYSMTDGQAGRTLSRRMQNLLKELEGAEQVLEHAGVEMEQAGRFMLMRDPPVVVEPLDAEARVTEEGQRDTRQVDAVARAVCAALEALSGVWRTVAAMEAAEMSVEDPAWPLLAKLDFASAGTVLETLQLDKRAEADGSRDRDEAESTLRWPSPQCPPVGVRDVSTPWWKGKSLRSSSRKATSPSPASAAQDAAPHAGPHSPAATSPESSPTKNSDEAGVADTPAVPPDGIAGIVDARPAQVRHLKGGHVYCGPTLNGEKVGAAVLEFANGDKYVGGFKKDTMEGHGVYEFAGHGHYAGQWANGAYHGAGVWSLPGGLSFRGGHAAGARHGWGIAVDASGAVYEGQWAGGRRNGLGSLRCEDGSTYNGEFRNNVRDGHGCHRLLDGTQYAGDFRGDAPHGHGALAFASGQKYEGQWAAGRREGWCLYSVSAGEVWAGRWAKGRPQWVEQVASTVTGAEMADEDTHSPVVRPASEAAGHAVAAGRAAREAAARAAVLANHLHSTDANAQVALRNSVLEADAAAEAAQRLSKETVAIAAAAKLNDTHKIASPKRPTKA